MAKQGVTGSSQRRPVWGGGKGDAAQIKRPGTIFLKEVTMTPEMITPGKSYNCTFTVKNIPLDRFGRPGGMYSLADLPVEKYGDYTSTGTIVARDLNTKLLEVQENNKTYVVNFENVENINEV